MTRFALPALTLFALLFSGTVSAQEWAKKMFKETEHDFGVVARGAPTEYRFVFQNIYKEDIHIAGVRSSCGCTSPRVEKTLVKTWEESEIICRYNTHSFLGAKGATVTVTIDRPYFAEIQLQVKGNIRGDVMFDPNLVNFGTVDPAATETQKVNINYSGGRSGWAIKDVRSANSYFGVRLKETSRIGGRVGYEMTIELKPGSPEGYFQDSLTVVTNDQANPRVTLPIQGNIASTSLVNLSPSLVSFGVVQSGEAATERLIVRSKEPFTIKSVKSSSPLVTFGDVSSEAKTLHLVPVKLGATAAGDMKGTITVETSLGTATCDVSASVQ